MRLGDRQPCGLTPAGEDLEQRDQEAAFCRPPVPPPPASPYSGEGPAALGGGRVPALRLRTTVYRSSDWPTRKGTTCVICGAQATPITDHPTGSLVSSVSPGYTSPRPSPWVLPRGRVLVDAPDQAEHTSHHKDASFLSISVASVNRWTNRWKIGPSVALSLRKQRGMDKTQRKMSKNRWVAN